MNIVRILHQDRLQRIEEQGDGDAAIRKFGDLHVELECFLISAERARIFELYRNGELKDEGRHRTERDLDMREAQLSNFRMLVELEDLAVEQFVSEFGIETFKSL